MAADVSKPIMGTVTEELPEARFRVRTAEGQELEAVLSVELGEPVVAAGDRVSVVTPEGAYPGVIFQVEPAPAQPPSTPFVRRDKNPSPEKLKIDRAARPDWPTGADRTPVVGEDVYCTEGMCSVARVLGRTGNGSRLLELRLGGDRKPFFAAASNVLVRPRED